MITTEFLTGLDRFNLVMKKRVTSKYAGARPSMMTGRGATIKDYRIYSAGDDFRLIDWKVYARTDNLYVKRYEEERNLVVHVIIDSSASMGYGKPSKFDYAAMLGVGFAYIAMRGNEKFRYAIFSNSLNVIQPKRGLSHLAGMVDLLNNTKPSGVSDFAMAMRNYRRALGKRSLIIIISDCLFDVDSIKDGLSQLGSNDIKLIQVLDPSERKLSIEGDVKLTDSETSMVMRTYISGKLRSDYQRKLESHIQDVEKISVGLRGGFHVVTTDTQVFDAFYRILQE
ncbi:DUF58 domain-containing protein [Candidatus Woesearchaeota archaeon]|nr:DUF58 domain-containing protein [Candidatus Woesearchaeota archaeon]